MIVQASFIDYLLAGAPWSDELVEAMINDRPRDMPRDIEFTDGYLPPNLPRVDPQRD